MHHLMTTWAKTVRATAATLAEAGIENAAQEARWMLEDLLGGKLELHDHPLSDDAAKTLDEWIARRVQGEPLQYILGHWSFCGLDLKVDPRVLIPRPETEQVVEVAIQELENKENDSFEILDLGTGSGAIALALASRFPAAHIYATDASNDALEVARGNAASLGIGNVEFCEGKWFEALPQKDKKKFALVVSNPPYVASSEQLPYEVKNYEPAIALDGGDDGLDALRIIISKAPEWLNAEGTFICEIGATQGEAVSKLARAAGFTNVEVLPDLSGHQRVLKANSIQR